MKCSNCGNNLNPGDNVCSNCGTIIANQNNNQQQVEPQIVNEQPVVSTTTPTESIEQAPQPNPVNIENNEPVIVSSTTEKPKKNNIVLIIVLALLSIVIGIVLFTAVTGGTAVIPMMVKSRYNAILDESYAFEKAAKLAFQDPTIGKSNENNVAVCYSLNSLTKNNFFTPSMNSEYHGSVLIYESPSGSHNYKYRIWYANESYGYLGNDKLGIISITANKASLLNEEAATYELGIEYNESDVEYYDKCGNNPNILSIIENSSDTRTITYIDE